MEEKTTEFEVIEPEYSDNEMIEDYEEETSTGIPTAIKVVAGGVVAAAAAGLGAVIAKKKGLLKKPKRFTIKKSEVEETEEIKKASDAVNADEEATVTEE